jgi:hypothetical protein
MEIREIFVQGSYWITPVIIGLLLVWIGLQVYIVFKRLRSHLTGSGSSAGSGSRRIGPKD